MRSTHTIITMTTIVHQHMVNQIYSRYIILTHPGPPESMREHVVAASKEMSKGNWRECADFVLAVKVKMRMLYSQATLKWLVV